MTSELKKFVLWGTYCDDVLTKRAPYREAHLANLEHLKASGQLQCLGPTADLKRVFGVYLAPDADTARQLVESDVYWQHGIWTNYELHPWNQVF